MLRRVPPFEACGGATGFGPWGSTTTLLIVILPTVFFNSGGHLPARSWLGSLFFLVKRLEINEENGRSFFS
jgi:hypothetical protein